MIEVSAALQGRARVVWDDLIVQCAHGHLPFIEIGSDPETIVSAWSVTDSGDELTALATWDFQVRAS
jgi:hypothetical protein